MAGLLAGGRGGKRRASKPRASALWAKIAIEPGEPSSTKRSFAGRPVATGAVNLARLNQESAHGWVNVHLHTSFVALHHQTIGADGYSPNCALHPPDHSLSY